MWFLWNNVSTIILEVFYGNKSIVLLRSDNKMKIPIHITNIL